jgi:hypothetical protein
VSSAKQVKAYRSTDGGKSFVSSGLVAAATVELGGVQYRPDGAEVVLPTRDGLYLSSDDGKTWRRIDQGTISHHFSAAKWLGRTLYSSTYGQGILRSQTER